MSDQTLHYTQTSLPTSNTYVIAHYTGGNWKDSDHQYGCEWKVVKFVRGITQAERAVMPDSVKHGTRSRNRVYTAGDEHGNNTVAYCWVEFGPGTLFGQEVDKWVHLPDE